MADRITRIRKRGILVRMSTALHEGDQALILDGPFTGRVGTLVRLSSDSVTVVCNVFDRDTPVVLGPDSVALPPSPGSGGEREPRTPLPSAGPAGASRD